jgi:hypothetical protein
VDTLYYSEWRKIMGVIWKRPPVTYKLMEACDTDKTGVSYSSLFAKDMDMNLFVLTKMCICKPIIRTT